MVPVILQGLGVGFIPRELVGKELETGSIVEIEIEEKIEGRHICIVEDRQKHLSMAARHLSRLLKGKAPS